MKKILLTLILLISAHSNALNFSVEKVHLQEGIKCLQKQYGIDINGAKSSAIVEKMNCSQKAQVSKDGEITNLNCPNDPVFEGFFTRGYSHKYQNNCLRSDRNKTTNIYENVNCACVRETLKGDFKGNEEKQEQLLKDRLKQFKKDLTVKANAKIGAKLVGKFKNIIKTDIILGTDKKKRHCFNKKFPTKLMNFINSKSCDGHRENLGKRMKALFGDSLDLDIADEDTNEAIIAKFKNALNNTNKSAYGKVSADSCLKDSPNFKKLFIKSVNQPRFVQMDETFDGFLKHRNLKYSNPNAGNLKDDFYKYFKDKNIQLHPILQSMAHNDLRGLLKNIQARTKAGMTLDDFLRSNKGENQKLALESSKMMCAYAFGDMTNVLCPKADLAFDDPKLIDSIFSSTNSRENSDLEKFKKSNILNLKALYCEQNDLHSIDKDGKILLLKEKFSQLQESKIKTRRLKTQDFDKSISILDKGSAKEAMNHLMLDLNDQIAISKSGDKITEEEVRDEVVTHRKLGRLNHFIDYFTIKRNKSNVDGQKLKISKNKRNDFVNSLLKLREKLENKKVKSVEQLSYQIHDIGNNSNISKKAFAKKFVKNYKDRDYTNGITEYMGHFDTPKHFNSKVPKCAAGFSNMYCNTITGLQGIDFKKINCSPAKLSGAAVDFITKTIGKKDYHQSFCDIRIPNQKMSAEITSKVSQFIKDKIKEPKFCSSQDYDSFAENMAKDFDIGRDSHHFNDSSRGIGERFIDTMRKSTSGIATNTKEESSSIFSDLGTNFSTNVFSNKSTTTDLVRANDITNSNSTSIFNGVKQTASKPLKNNQIAQKKVNSQKIDQSNQDLLDYIKQLEEKITKQEENFTERENKDAPITELDELRKEIDKLRVKTAEVKKQYKEKSKAIASDKKKASPTASSSSRTNVFGVPSSNQGTVAASAPEEFSEQEQVQTVAPTTASQVNANPGTSANSNSTANSNVSLSLNEQFDEILSKSGSKESVEISFNNEKFQLELAVSEDGEMICKFSDQKLNETNREELDQICKGYIESINKRNVASEDESKNLLKKKKPVKKEKLGKPPTKLKRQKFNVEDLNQVLEN
ncbi:hypothetical protein A9Q84_06190 [Halobacteriovorax marinus]|uniref:SAP domain-containing protein n=1 Tax=Halobacteriovorax marinus TaxID=97084 RepID=A0A1Y5F9J1_9BACT|nr:hypothetical protein A9Q84_06190 [Halobacteriovorax marinus]